MKIKNPDLSHVFIKNPITLKPNSSLQEARELLLRNKIKRIVITKSKKPVGIVSEKDIARTLLFSGNKSMKSIEVQEMMKKNPATLKKTDSIYDCASLMKYKKIGSIVIVDDKGIAVGIITKTDLVSVFLTSATNPIPVSKIMTRKVITASPNDPILYVENLLLKNRISRVVIQRDRVPIGIITLRDFVPAKIPRWITESADPKEVEKYQKRSDVREYQVNQMSYLIPFNAVDIMSTNPITTKPDEMVGNAVMLMIRKDVSGIPVVKNSKIVGIVTKSDIINEIANR